MPSCSEYTHVPLRCIYPRVLALHVLISTYSIYTLVHIIYTCCVYTHAYLLCICSCLLSVYTLTSICSVYTHIYILYIHSSQHNTYQLCIYTLMPIFCVNTHIYLLCIYSHPHIVYISCQATQCSANSCGTLNTRATSTGCYSCPSTCSRQC